MIAGGVVAGTRSLWRDRIGMFARAGVNVDYQRVASGTAATLGVISGTYQVAKHQYGLLINAHVRGVPLTIIASGDVQRNDRLLSGVVAGLAVAEPPTPQRESARDYRRCGPQASHSRTGSTSTAAIRRRCAQWSILRPRGTEEGRIDVAVLLQPFLSQALARGTSRIFADTYQGGRCATAVVGATPPGSMQSGSYAAVRVMRDAMIYANGHRTETAAILSKNSGADVDAILRGGRETFPRTSRARDFQPIVDLTVKYGLIPSASTQPNSSARSCGRFGDRIRG